MPAVECSRWPGLPFLPRTRMLLLAAEGAAAKKEVLSGETKEPGYANSRAELKRKAEEYV